jgi:DivIVA domain-containing protein
MTMTLDEVRKTRFHMSRRNGYEVTDVDIFVDKVEATLMTITEQNDHLRRQLEAAQTGGNNPELQAEVDRLRAEVQRLRGAADEVASLHGENQRLQAELDQARAGAGDSGLVEENQRLRQLVDTHQREAAEQGDIVGENERLRAQVAEFNARPAAVASPDGGGLQHIVVTTSGEASAAVIKLVQLATEQAESLVQDAQSDAQRRLSEAEEHAAKVTQEADAQASTLTQESQAAAQKLAQESQLEAQRIAEDAATKAHDSTTDARTRADRVESEARVNAEKLVQEAEARASSVERDANFRRAELLTALEKERDALSGHVGKLRDFESTYRDSLVTHLSGLVDDLKNRKFEPADAPQIGQTTPPQANSGSQTPRLDALLTNHD